MRTKEETEFLILFLGMAIIKFERDMPVIANWCLEKQIELKREIMEGEEFRAG
jgi:hypothetical protein